VLFITISYPQHVSAPAGHLQVGYILLQLTALPKIISNRHDRRQTSKIKNKNKKQKVWTHVFLISALVGGDGQLHVPANLSLRKEALVSIG
jgi:hypothetical protein